MKTYRLLPIICKMRGLRKFDIGGANFFGLKANKKHAQMLSAIVTEFVRLVNGEDEESVRRCSYLKINKLNFF